MLAEACPHHTPPTKVSPSGPRRLRHAPCSFETTFHVLASLQDVRMLAGAECYVLTSLGSRASGFSNVALWWGGQDCHTLTNNCIQEHWVDPEALAAAAEAQERREEKRRRRREKRERGKDFEDEHSEDRQGPKLRGHLV